MRAAAEILTEFGVPHEARVVSAHRTPDLMFEFASHAEARGIEAVRQDRAAYDLPPGDPRPASLASPEQMVRARAVRAASVKAFFFNANRVAVA